MEIMGNTVKTALLLGALTGLLMFIGGLVGGRGGVYVFFILALILNLGSYWFSDKIVLKMYKAQEVSEIAAPDLFNIVRNLALKAQLPMPRVYIIPEETANAFATGRNANHAVVAVTAGIMRILNKEELEGVISHELTHIKNSDMLISSIAATIAGAIGMLAHAAQWAAIFGSGRSDDDDHGGIIGLIAMAIFAPLAAAVIQMAISRSREYMADAGGANITKNPYGLASALEKLSRASQIIPMDANPSTAHLFIVNPLTGKSLMNLFSTHPPMEERIARLRSMKPY
jgi:heat shock protein HtpX